MLLNTWLTAAKRHLFRSAMDGQSRRRISVKKPTAAEALESRSLLTALVINSQNLNSFVDGGTGQLSIDNAVLGTHDEIVIEEVDIASTVEGISIDLTGVELKRLAIETVNVTAFSQRAIDINLTNVTGNRTISLEDITITQAGAGIDLDLDNTDSYAVTIEDSIVPSVNIHAKNGSDISFGQIVGNEINAPADVEALVLTVDTGSDADNFHIVDNRQIQALNRDAVQINLSDADTDGLRILNNVIGNEPGADVLFRANGDTFVQPFTLTNNGADGELLEQFVLDLTSIGLVFDEGVDGKPFTVVGNPAINATASLSSNNQILTVDFTDFQPGETFQFVIDIDVAPETPGDPPVAAPIFGNDLIGAAVTFNFDAGNSGSVPKQVAGTMVGDAEVFNASLFARGAGAAANLHGINLNLSNSPLTNAELSGNSITGVAGHGILFDAAADSHITALVDQNSILSGGQDGIRLDLEDSNFTGSVRNNTIGQNSGYGINFQPSVSRSGIVEEAFDGSPVEITSTNHGLQTGDVIVIQGMTNANPNIVHPGNGIHTITRTGNNTFTLDGVSGLGAGINYNAGGAWYVPDFDGGVINNVPQGPARGFVKIDVKATEAEGRITEITNPNGGGDVQIRSVGHGLTSGDRVRITGATGTLLDGDYKITVIDDNTFSLDGATSGGTYDKSGGLAVWRANLITDATNPLTGEIVITSVGHGLQTGEEVRIAEVLGNTNANGTYTITRLSADTFALQGSSGSGTYETGTGYWTVLAEATFTNDVMPQVMSGNSITNNGRAGIYVDLETGTGFDGDIIRNDIERNAEQGVHIESHSYGVGATLPLDPNDPLALPGKQDISFNVNIGSEVDRRGGPFNIPLDGNVIDANGGAGIAIEVLDLATGSFEIQGNKITRSIDDNDANTAWRGDGIYVALESDRFAVDSEALLVESVIENNTIGVDSQGNEGHGLNFRLRERTRIQDLEVVKNFFGNNGDDGFHFERTENGSLNAVVMDNNDVTNNQGDGFDLYAENSVDDRLDFKILRNDINDNAQYGVRINVQAAARIEVDFNTNDVIGNGHTPGGTGFHPDDAATNFVGHYNGPNFAGNAGAAGGVGIFGFEEVEVVFNAVDSNISGNIGDGFSIDTFDAIDTFRLDASFTDVNLNSNTLTGFRSHGAAFANIEFVSSTFNRNREDGVRIVSIDDKDDFFRRRVAGADIDIYAIGNQFVGNWLNGAVLGQAVSAVFGTGSTTAEFANIFDSNGFTDANITGVPSVNTGGDGLKITQNVGPYLHKLGRRRVIEMDSNFFRNNGGHGIDVGHYVATEGGNVEHGYEVASDVDVTVNNAVISGNRGDGIEWLTDSVLRIPPLVGSQQEIIGPTDISSLQVSNSRIESNRGRGVDILNRVSEDIRVTLTNNEILTNTLSGVYVLNTASHNQTQVNPDDDLDLRMDIIAALTSPNVELRVQANNILDNGNQQSVSTVTIPSSGQDDSSGIQNPDWTHDYTTVTGTLGGLVVRVGTVDSVGRLRVANPELELAQSGIDAEVLDNTFNGNFGASAFFDAFTSALAWQSQGEFDDDTANHAVGIDWDQGTRDPLARFDLVFRGNQGNSLDVVNGFAFQDNEEDYFKSRHPLNSTSPPSDHAHGGNTLTPGGHFLRGVPGGTDRARIGTRTAGFFNVVGQVPGSTYQGTPFEWSYDGHGTPTWRVESDYDFNNFAQTSTTQGFSTFHDTVILDNSGFYEYQWDTGRNTSNFTGLTPYSLFRGDVFNVDDGESYIRADGLEENDSFRGATDMGVVAGPNFSVNALTNNSLQPGVLNIERKGDRDYYRFRTAEVFANGDPGLVNVNLGTVDGSNQPLDPDGDLLRFMIYEVRPQTDTEEVPLIAVDGIPQYTTVTNGGTGFIQVAVQPDTEYIIEVLSQEGSNLGTSGGGTGGTNFVYGTTRGYTLSLDAPVAQPPVQAGRSAGSGGQVVHGSSGGRTLPVSVPDEAPTVADITNVQANPANPINVAVDTITVRFSEDVTGVDKADFQLTRDGVVLDLSGAILNPVDREIYEITNLASLTNQAGDYVFSVLIASSGIIDTDGEPLEAGGNDSESWTLDNVVNSTIDAVDNIAGDGFIADANGNRTLRAAINEANANQGADVITLAPGTYLLTLGGRFEDEGFKGDLDIRESLTIRGSGTRATDTVIDAGDLDRVFHVFPGVELILENLTIQGGEAYDGAGIFVEGTTTFSGLQASTGGMVEMTDVNVIDNEAYNQGGGIYNLGSVDATRSSISRNVAGSRGGGIFNHGDVDLVNSTISSNTAVSRGGGIYNERLATRVNTTISPIQAVGSLYALNSTIAFNAAGAAGGGLYQESSSTYELGNTIVDSNTAASAPNLSGTVNSLGFNFIGTIEGTRDDRLLQPTDILADAVDGPVNAGLAPLSTAGLNGTWNHSPTAGAAVVDAGSDQLYADELGVDVNALINDFDQVKRPRQIEGDDDGTFRIDIGAVEYFVSHPVAIVTATPNPAGVNEQVSLNGSQSTHTLVPGSSKIVSYEWDFTYDGVTFQSEASGSTATTSYPSLGTFTVALRVTDDVGAVDIETIVITVAAPTKPVITAPFAGGTSDSTPTITWDAGTGNFDLLVTDAGGTAVIDVSGLTSSSFTPTTSLTPGTYTAVVTATNASGSASSDPYSFEVVRMQIIDPAHRSIEFDTTPEFVFTAIPNASRYQVWVSEQDPTDRRVTLGIRINDSFINAANAQIPGTNNASYEPSTALGEGYFRVWVRAIEANGNFGDWSAGHQFQIVRPVITGEVPANTATIDSTPTITWTDVGANQYEIWITQLNGTTPGGTALTGPTLITNLVGIQGTSYTPTDPLGNGDFRVWVRPLDDDGEPGLWSRQFNFTKNLTVGPTQIAPAHRATQTDRTPEFVWEALHGADRYELWVNNINTGQARVIHNTQIPHVEGASTISYTDPTVVLRNATYRWWVRAFNEEGQATAWTSAFQFWVPAPVIQSPVGVITNTNLPTFSWTTVPEYVRFELWVNNLDTGTNRVLYRNDLTTNSFTPSLPLENGNFRTWVRAFDANNNPSQWSNPVDFSIDAAVSSAPQLFGPGGTTTDNTPTFAWSTLANVTQYELLIKDIRSPEQPTVVQLVLTPDSQNGGTAFYTLTTNLAPGRYRWWVRGLNADGKGGPWAQPLDFTVVQSDVRTLENDSRDTGPELLTVSLAAADNWADEVRSITVHPLATVASVAVDRTDNAAPVEAVPSEETSAAMLDLDAIMEEFAAPEQLRNAEWTGVEALTDAVTDPASEGEAVVATEESDRGNVLGAALLGLGVSGATHDRRRRRTRRF